jgi:hypothetical protein
MEAYEPYSDDAYGGCFVNAVPDVESVGRAWKLPLFPRTKNQEACLCHWLVDTKGFGHPLWYMYWVSTMFLRAEDGIPEGTKLTEDCTHQILFGALTPMEPLPDFWNGEQAGILSPIDLQAQFVVRTDEQAIHLTELVVRHICDGVSPDQDMRHYWASSINKTTEHILFGCHPEDN